jgi:MoaA/NifB/PqqE/SkfB family radical SAM enzyme
MYKHLLSVELSLTDICNMTCVFCPHSTTFGNPAHYMSEETLHLALDHILEFDQPIKIAINGRGEPTLHTHFESMIQIIYDRIKDTPHFINMSTNAARLNRYEHLIPLFNRINISIYDEHSHKQIKDLVTLYSRVNNINIVLKRTAVSSNYRLNPESSKQYKKIYTNRAGNVNHKLTQQQHVPHPKYASACHKPFSAAFIEYNGNYGLCCDNWSREVSLSNVYEQSIKEAYTKNNTFRDIAIDLLQGKREQFPCKNCNRNLKWNDKLSEAHFKELQREHL